ncbi:hypothetical protein J2802_005372, partial [Paraburkholderia caribensis]|nr:hypothetical protein [Paraburkholderia caribensis]
MVVQYVPEKLSLHEGEKCQGFGLVWFGLVWFGLVWFGLVWFGLVWFGLVLPFAFAGIRDALARFTRRPCAGRHLLFFAAAKK